MAGMNSLSERDALEHLRLALTASVAADLPDLTARQLAILCVVALEPGPHTVRGLAARLDLSKPVITRNVDALARYDFVRRRADESDLRSVFIERTVDGMTHLRRLAAPMLTGPAPPLQTEAAHAA